MISAESVNSNNYIMKFRKAQKKTTIRFLGSGQKIQPGYCNQLFKQIILIQFL